MIWNNTNIDHALRRILDITIVQYEILVFVYWNQGKVIPEWMTIGAPKIAQVLCLSTSTVQTAIDKLFEKNLLVKPSEIEIGLILSDFNLDGRFSNSLKAVSEEVDKYMNMDAGDIFDRYSSLTNGQDLKFWRYSNMQYVPYKNILKKHKISHSQFLLLDIIRNTMLSESYGGLGWCNHSRKTLARLMGMTVEGLDKMVDKIDSALVSSGVKGWKTAEEFNGEFLGEKEPRSVKLAQAVKIDKQVNEDIEREVLWRLDHEYSNQELFEMFGDDSDLLAEKMLLAEKWVESGEKELYPHPKSGRSRNWEYQRCLKGFKKWVSTYASSRNETPVKDRKMTTSRKAFDIAYEDIKRTCVAYGKGLCLFWTGRDKWEVSEGELQSFVKTHGYDVDQKRKYIIFCATETFAGFGYDLNNIIGRRIDDYLMKRAVDHFEMKSFLGRPLEMDRIPPKYTQKPMPPGFSKVKWRTTAEKDYFKQHDIENPPLYCFDRNGNKIADWT